MPSAIPDLWPDDLSVADVVPPVVILRQQASLLGKKFKYVIEGEVQSDELGGNFVHSLYIVAPALGDYHYLLCRVTHDIEPYPLRIIDVKDLQQIPCKDEQEFIKELGNIFQSEWTRRVMASLIAQSEAIPETPTRRRPSA